jgi:cystathionine beta-lyase/cystathionine gamma-synthase
MERNCANAGKVAAFLEQHPKVRHVNYPGLTSHPGHSVAQRQMKDFGAMLSFYLKEDTVEAAIPVMEKVRLFTLAESLGGVESLCGHPATMSHGSMKREDRLAVGIRDSMIRLSIGIEDADDLIDDLAKALG